MVLDLLDLHPETWCRNEPNELHGSAFDGLGDPMFGGGPADFAARWRVAVSLAAQSQGARDRFTTTKSCFRGPNRARIGQGAVARGKLRSLWLPRRDRATVEEWIAPRFHIDRAALRQMQPVLKILLAPAWTLAGRKAIPDTRVFHVLRAPDGFAQSWWGRYVNAIGGGPEQVFADNQPSLIRILRHFGRADEMPEDYSLRALVVSELWRWRYMNEIVLEGLAGSDGYLLIPYEGVMADRPGWARRIFDAADLDMTEDIATAVADMRNTLFSRRKGAGLDAAMVSDAIDEVLDGSPYAETLRG